MVYKYRFVHKLIGESTFYSTKDTYSLRKLLESIYGISNVQVVEQIEGSLSA